MGECSATRGKLQQTRYSASPLSGLLINVEKGGLLMKAASLERSSARRTLSQSRRVTAGVVINFSVTCDPGYCIDNNDKFSASS